jgi:hypothetical protein
MLAQPDFDSARVFVVRQGRQPGERILTMRAHPDRLLVSSWCLGDRQVDPLWHNRVNCR